MNGNKNILIESGISPEKANEIQDRDREVYEAHPDYVAISNYINKNGVTNDDENKSYQGHVINAINSMRNKDDLLPLYRKAFVDNNTSFVYDPKNPSFIQDGDKRIMNAVSRTDNWLGQDLFHHETFHNLDNLYGISNKMRTRDSARTLKDIISREGNDRVANKIMDYINNDLAKHSNQEYVLRMKKVLSDMANAMSMDHKLGKGRHGVGYWEKHPDNQVREFVAQMGALLALPDGAKYYRKVKEFMPISVAAFEDIMGQLYGR